jgi:23S rRNA (pseudouridine1915-N3)-methyltransferase
VLLHETGKKRSSQDFAAKLMAWRAARGPVRFLIGGSYGFDRAELEGLVDETMSLGEMTLPHALATVVLLEQIYRAGQIAKGTGYHH